MRWCIVSSGAVPWSATMLLPTRTRRALAWSIAGALLVCACQLIAGIDGRSVAQVEAGRDSEALLDAGANDAGSDALADGGAPGCGSYGPPSPPVVNDGTADLTFTLAVRFFGLVPGIAGGAPTPLGMDLDHVCTCPGPESCTPLVVGAQHCDEEAGRDSYGNTIFTTLETLTGNTFQSNLTSRFNSGAYGLVLQIQGYNGGANDSQVKVAYYSSDGVLGMLDGGSPAAWDGTDRWTLDSNSVFGGGGDGSVIIPNYYDQAAYVANHVLVSSVDFPLTLGGLDGDPLMILNLTGGVVTGTLTPQGSSYAIEDGQLSGRWSTAAALAASHTLRDPLHPSQFLCPGNMTYESGKMLTCRVADINANPVDDRTGAPCDALAVGSVFTAYPALVGGIATRPYSPDPCGEAGVDDCPLP